MLSEVLPTAPSEDGWLEFRRGWAPLLAAFVGNALSGGTLCFYSLGILAPPLRATYGWGTGAISGSLLAMTGATLIVSPLIGVMTDRIGVKRIAAISAALMALALSLLAIVPLSIPLYLGIWALVAIAGAGCLPVTWSRLVNQHFRTKRGLALGISFVGSGLTGFLLKPMLFSVITTQGLRAGFLFLAAIPLITLISTIILVRRAPNPGELNTASNAEQAAGFTLSESLRDRRFWVLAIVVTLAAFGVGGPLPNMESALRSLGHSSEAAIAAAQGIGIAIIFGRLGGGAVLDRLWAPAVGSIGLLAGALGCLALWAYLSVGTPAKLDVFLVGLASGLEVDLVAFLVVRYFGLKSYAAIYGVFYGLFALGTGLGAIVFGAASDAFHSFRPALAVFGGALLASGLIILSLGPYRFKDSR